MTFSRFQTDRKVISKKTKKVTQRLKSTLLFLELFVICLKIVSKHYPENFETFLRQVWDQEEETEQLEEDDSFFSIDYRRKIRNYFYEVWD